MSFKELWQSSLHQSVEEDLAWLKKIRRQQFEQFLLEELPTTKEENWKYTNLNMLSQQSFLVPAKTNFEPSVAQIKKLYLSIPHHRLVFVNGYYRQDLSKFFDLPRKAIVTHLESAWKKHADMLQPFFTSAQESALQCLNTAFMTDGAFIYLPAKNIIDLPIHVLHLTTSQNFAQPSMVNIRNIILCEDQSQLTLLEDYQSCDDQLYFMNTHTQIFAANNCHIQHYKLQNENKNAFHIASTMIKQQQNSSVSSHSYSLGSQLTRMDVQVELEGKHAESSTLGLYLTKNTQHVDHHIRVDHRAENTQSKSLYKGIVADKSHAVFNGKIVVHQDAQQTRAVLQNQNLLLTPEAQVSTKPELEIFTDDVQCSHSATIGQLDAEMLFYLRSRGMPETLAYHVLIMAFATQILDIIQVPCFAEKIMGYVFEELGNEEKLENITERLFL